MEQEHIRVALRERPLSESEKEQKMDHVWEYEGTRMSLRKREAEEYSRGHKVSLKDIQHHKLQHVFLEEDNSALYRQEVQPLVRQGLAGMNSTLMVYGQTGAGKTHTLLGHQHTAHRRSTSDLGMSFGQSREKGVLIMALEEVVAAQREEDYSLECEYLEIYNDKVVDLLGEEERAIEVSEDT